ncbi:uncharacterized protein [Watersipora subatra]|uniref:uncharacterized protein isoform X2 n=1 Tax=Watersipora subatra TaxID=2589382 RepID=UPI00355C49C1
MNEVEANTPDTITAGKNGWKAYVSQRSKAMPKNSLFGSVLENVDKAAAASINSKAYEEEIAAQRLKHITQYDHKLPSNLQPIAAKDQLEMEQSNIKAKQDKLGEREQAVMDMERQAKYYGSIPTPLQQNQQLKKKMLLADPGLDLELTKKMNDIGYAERNSYNKDKHRQRPPVHKYAVIGDPLEYGMDFSLNQTETHDKFDKPTQTTTNRHYRSLRQHKSAPAVASEPGSIPANIRARYGSKIVAELFADEEAVGRVKKRMNEELIRQRMPHRKVALPPVEIVTPKNYGDLSHALRQDKFGGHSYLNASLMKDSHTQDVFDRRYKDPDEYRHTWDEYGKWAAMNLQREQQKRLMDEVNKAAA